MMPFIWLWHWPCFPHGIDLESLLFWGLLDYLTAMFTFLSTNQQDAHLLLEMNQQAEYTRRLHTVGNATAHVVNKTRDKTVLCEMRGDDWEDISQSYGYGVDYVALVLDDDAKWWIADELLGYMHHHERNDNGDAVFYSSINSISCIGIVS